MEHKNKSCTVFNWQKNHHLQLRISAEFQTKFCPSLPTGSGRLCFQSRAWHSAFCPLELCPMKLQIPLQVLHSHGMWLDSAWTSGSHCDCSQSSWQLGFSYHILWGPHISEQPTTTTCFSIWDCKSNIKFSMKTSLQLQYYFKRHLYYKKI